MSKKMIFHRRTNKLLGIASIILCFIKEVLTFLSCHSSLETLQKVDRCPRNKLEWDLKAVFINCSSINQTCVSKAKFVYHCVLNADGTALVEVCAPYTFIHGKRCTEFDSKGSIIQENANSCSNSTVSCPAVYKSTDAYNYQYCYDNIQANTKAVTATNQTNSRSCFVWIAILLSTGIFVVVVIIFINNRKTRHLRNQQFKFGQQEIKLLNPGIFDHDRSTRTI